MFDMHSDFVGYDDVVPSKMDRELREEHTAREWSWIHFVAKEYGLTVQWLGNAQPAELEACAEAGERVYNQMLVRPQSFIMCFASRGHPFIASDTFRQAMKQPDWPEKLAQPATKAAVLGEILSLIQEDSEYGRLYKRQVRYRTWN